MLLQRGVVQCPRAVGVHGRRRFGYHVAMRFEARVRRPLRTYFGRRARNFPPPVAALVLLSNLTGLLRLPSLRNSIRFRAINVSVRVSSAFLVLAVPSASMGATLPAAHESPADEPGPSLRWAGHHLRCQHRAAPVLGVLGREPASAAVGVFGAGLGATLLNVVAGVLALRLERRAVPALKRERTRCRLRDCDPSGRCSSPASAPARCS